MYLLYYLSLIIIWGLNPIYYKILLNDINYETLLLLVSFIYFIGLLFYIIISKKRCNIIKNDIRFFNKKILLIILILGISLLIAQFLYLYVIKNDKLHISTIISSCYPIITIIIAYLFFKEKINIYRLIGILLVLLGLIILKYN